MRSEGVKKSWVDGWEGGRRTSDTGFSKRQKQGHLDPFKNKDVDLKSICDHPDKVTLSKVIFN